LPKGAGGWAGVKVLKKAEIFQKNDERILGDGGFVEKVLSQARENLDHCYRIRAQGLKFQSVLDRVKELTSVEPELILMKDRRLETVRARSLACYLAVEELGLTQPEISLKSGMMQAVVSIAVRRGAQFAVESECRLREFMFLCTSPNVTCRIGVPVEGIYVFMYVPQCHTGIDHDPKRNAAGTSYLKYRRRVGAHCKRPVANPSEPQIKPASENGFYLLREGANYSKKLY
jgi:hypothetical protein